MSNYPFLHRGRELSYIWDANKSPIGQNTIDSNPYFVVKDTIPSQFGSQKYTKIQDFFDDSIDIPYIKTVSRRRQSFVATIVTDVPHQLQVGQAVTISGLGGSGYNGNINVFSVVSPTEFTYQSFFGDESTTSDNNGVISYSLYKIFINPDYYNGIGIDYAQINYEVNNSLGLTNDLVPMYFSNPFPLGHVFSGWTLWSLSCESCATFDTTPQKITPFGYVATDLEVENVSVNSVCTPSDGTGAILNLSFDLKNNDALFSRSFTSLRIRISSAGSTLGNTASAGSYVAISSTPAWSSVTNPAPPISCDPALVSDTSPLITYLSGTVPAGGKITYNVEFRVYYTISRKQPIPNLTNCGISIDVITVPNIIGSIFFLQQTDASRPAVANPSNAIYYKNSDPNTRIPSTDKIFFDGIGTTSYYYINKTRFGDFQGVNTRADRRNKRSSYNLHVRYSFTGRIRFTGTPLISSISFNLKGFRGEPTQQYSIPPFTGYDFFSVYELINKSDYIDTCPIKTLHKIDQNVCDNFIRNFTGSNTLVDDSPPLSGWYSTNYPDEIGDFLLGCYNSVLNMNLDCHWKSVVLPYFVSFCDPERQFRYSRLETILH